MTASELFTSFLTLGKWGLERVRKQFVGLQEAGRARRPVRLSLPRES